MTEQQQITEDPGKSRAAFIRALVAAGIRKPKTIIQHCVDAGLGAPTNQAVISARNYVPKGGPVNARPTYRFLCEEFLASYRRAVDAGLPIVITADMKQHIIVMEHCTATDTAVETRKIYRQRQRRKKQRERKAKAQPKS